MRSFIRILAAAASLITACAAVAVAQGGKGVIRVEVTDSSGGRLPGVSVVATPASGQVLTAATDRTGGSVFRAVSAGPVMLRFRLEGFESALVGVTVQPNTETRVTQRMELAPLAETVIVRAPAPVEPPPPPPPPPPPVRPASRVPLIQPVPAHDRDSVCGPSKPAVPAESLGTIRSTRFVAEGGLYTTGASISVDGGTLNGLEVGQNLVVRHYFKVPRRAGTDSTGEHSAGLVQLVSVSERSSMAVVVYACDLLRAGDFLASFRPEPVRSPERHGTPNFGDPARILFGDEGLVLAAPRRLMVIDRGSGHGIRVGQRLTLFRRDAGKPDVVGDAIVVATRIDSATIRVERVNDVVSPGDLAAPQIPDPATSR